ncbi:hypothetical protein [Peribacillus sp. TH14]|uniref:hypothetical protein n=1 Tax=Peribacillus sp. TH14 TaxID=2798481 RepID=UPI0019141DB5|nr:hypothetical protein [Peribacillus sp. TH14]MBK5502781.1 hypothetical protein [Peribacillus sp. TH14]
MILNRVLFAREAIITILHRGFDNDCNLQGNIYIKKKLGRYNLVFEQSIVNDEILDNLNHVVFIEEGFLNPKHELNPYSQSKCTFMRRFVSSSKPKKIIKALEDKFELKLSLKDLLIINEFIKKYTGLDLNRNPILYGDTLLYEPISVSFKPNHLNGITFNNLEKDSIVIVKFKNKDIIVSSHLKVIESFTSELEINPSEEWKSLDIEIFKNNRLVYFNYNLSYISTVHLSMGMASRSKRIKLNELDDFFELQNDPSKHEMIIGEAVDKLEELFWKSNNQMRQKLLKEQEKENITFIKPGETKKSIEIISKYLQESQDEFWVFDPYFTDKNRFNKTLDWLRIFYECSSQPKNIVFFCKDEDKAYDFVTIKEAIKQDSVLKRIVKKGILNLNFIQISSPIHDRFILGRNKNTFSGLTIGTSLNSIDSNHFCINILNHSAAKKILGELNDYINEGNLVGSCEI